MASLPQIHGISSHHPKLGSIWCLSEGSTGTVVTLEMQFKSHQSIQEGHRDPACGGFFPNA